MTQDSAGDDCHIVVAGLAQHTLETGQLQCTVKKLYMSSTAFSMLPFKMLAVSVLTWLGALSNLDLHLISVGQELGRDAKPAGGDLLDAGVGGVPRLQTPQMGEGG